MPKRSFVHVINPVVAKETSDLFIAQPITFAAINAALKHNSEDFEVKLYSTQYAEDRKIVPDFAIQLSDLQTSVLDYHSFNIPRKLPILQEIISKILTEIKEADYIIYTNVDIAPLQNFYCAINSLINKGFTAFAINRRTIRKDWAGGIDDLPLMAAELGEPHPGRDCFVFPWNEAKNYDLGKGCIGAQFIGKILAANMMCFTKNYSDFENLHLTFHLGADQSWIASPFADYNQYNRKQLSEVLTRQRNQNLSCEHPAYLDLQKRFLEL